MYLRVSQRRNRKREVVRYVQLAHNERNHRGVPVARVIHNFGREEEVDRAALARLVASISRFLALELTGEAGGGADSAGVLEPEPPPCVGSRRPERTPKRTRVWEAASHRGRHALERYLLAVVSERAIVLAAEPASSCSAPEQVGSPEGDPGGAHIAPDSRGEGRGAESIEDGRDRWQLGTCVWCGRLTPCATESELAGGPPTG